MDKFVQLPFVIPPVTSETQQDFVDVLMGASSEDKPASATTSPPASARSPSEQTTKITIEQFRDTVDKAGAFDDNNPEVQRLIRSSMPLFKGNPRELKIFLNLFRFN